MGTKIHLQIFKFCCEESSQFYVRKTGASILSLFKEGSPIWVDRICTLGPKVHNLQGENDSVTPRVLELELSF